MQTRMLNGYVVIYDPAHPRAMTSKNWFGYVYEHIKVAEDALGRSLTSDEEVHHLDTDRANNRSDNLLVLLKSQHTKLHNWLRKGAPGSKGSGANRVNSGKPKAVYCSICSKVLVGAQDEFCSKKCSGLSPRRRKVDRPSKAQLEEDLKVNTWSKVGAKYGVSDNAVRKWARQYELLWQS